MAVPNEASHNADFANVNSNMVASAARSLRVSLPQSDEWTLTAYERQRKPQPLLTNAALRVHVHPDELRSELVCPICLDVLRRTKTTKECLHRFCSSCIITALRSGNKECPTCRKKLVSKRSLQDDTRIDAIIARLFPNREDGSESTTPVITSSQNGISTEASGPKKPRLSGPVLDTTVSANPGAAIASVSIILQSLPQDEESDTNWVGMPISEVLSILEKRPSPSKGILIPRAASVDHLCDFLSVRSPSGTVSRDSHKLFMAKDGHLQSLRSSTSLEEVCHALNYGERVHYLTIYYVTGTH